MSPSIHERRKFVRIETNLYGLLNRRHRVAIKRLSLGGCLIETSETLEPAAPVKLEFSCGGESVSVTAQPVNTPGENQFGLRFEAEEHDQALRLANIIQQIQETPSRRRPQRLRLVREALVDNTPAVLTNLGEGGCFVRTRGNYRRGDVVEVGFELNQQSLWMPAQVRWRTPLGIGVQYLSPDPAQIRIISDFISLRRPASG
jgi:hypothetical protein